MLRNCLIGLAAATMTVTPAAARDRTYDSQGRYIEPRQVSAGEVWQGRDGRY